MHSDADGGVRAGDGNADPAVVAGFGDEWTRFDQSGLSPDEARQSFAQYFRIFPWNKISATAVGADIGCGSGRWARLVAPRVGRLHCVDASAAALAVAQRNLQGLPNCEFHHASVDRIPIVDGSLDFLYTLGVLHHAPDTAAGIRQCVAKLRPGAPLLLYLYYRFDGRPRWYVWLWKCTDLVRRTVSRFPHFLRFFLSQLIAAAVYWPLARAARLAEHAGISPRNMPLAYYRHRSFYTMRTDALDRFGTRLEQRFTRSEIEKMMREAGLTDITFSEEPPFWCAVGFRHPS